MYGVSMQSFVVKDQADGILATQLLPLTQVALMRAEQSRALSACSLKPAATPCT